MAGFRSGFGVRIRFFLSSLDSDRDIDRYRFRIRHSGSGFGSVSSLAVRIRIGSGTARSGFGSDRPPRVRIWIGGRFGSDSASEPGACLPFITLFVSTYPTRGAASLLALKLGGQAPEVAAAAPTQPRGFSPQPPRGRPAWSLAATAGQPRSRRRQLKTLQPGNRTAMQPLKGVRLSTKALQEPGF